MAREFSSFHTSLYLKEEKTEGDRCAYPQNRLGREQLDRAMAGILTNAPTPRLQLPSTRAPCSLTQPPTVD